MANGDWFYSLFAASGRICDRAARPVNGGRASINTCLASAGASLKYTIFISHGWHDRWIAKQMARIISDAGGTPFIDIFDIKIGDRIAERVHEGTRESRELIALLTPWSVDRNWVWTEIAAAWALRETLRGCNLWYNYRRNREKPRWNGLPRPHECRCPR